LVILNQLNLNQNVVVQNITTRGLGLERHHNRKTTTIQQTT